MHVTNAYVILFLVSAKTGDTGIFIQYCTGSQVFSSHSLYSETALIIQTCNMKAAYFECICVCVWGGGGGGREREKEKTKQDENNHIFKTNFNETHTLSFQTKNSNP